MSTKNTLFSYNTLVHAVAGAAGSATAMTACFPLDTARTRLQVDDDQQAKYTPLIMAEILKEEGLQGLYRGLLPVVSSLCCSNFVYFYTFHGLKAVVGKDDASQDALKDLVLAFIAGVVNVLATSPMWVVNTRLKLQGAKLKTKHLNEQSQNRYNGVIDAFVKIVKQEGVKTLWSGTVPSLFLVSNPALQFMVYEGMKRQFRRILQTKELSGWLFFWLGAAAKTFATIITYPMQVVQSRLRSGQSSDKEGKRQSIKQILEILLKTQGVRGLYKGLEAKLLQTVLTAALMMVMYEKIAAFIFKLMRLSNSRP